MLATNTDT